MAKTLKDFLEGYLKVKSADEQKFVDKHVTAKNPDRNGNGDDVFKGATKPIDRRKDRKGYNPGEDEKVYEALKGSQHKIDANKNGKVDAHDFHLLRKKKKVAEEAKLAEADIKKSDVLHKGKVIGEIGIDTDQKGNGQWYAKHHKSGHDTSGHDSAEDARAEVMAAHGINEEVKELEELSTDTLRSYRAKAKGDAEKISFDDEGADRRMRKRSMGSWDAGKKILKRGDALRKEESEQIDELSKKTLGSYVVKSLAPGSEKSVSNLASKGGYKLGQAHDDDYTAGEKEDAKSVKRSLGVLTAVRKMTKEESELEEKLTAKTPMGKYIKDFSKSDAPQFKGKSQQKRRVMAIAAKLTAERGGKPLNKEERLQDRLGDISESHQRVMLEVFGKLNEDNKTKFMTACATPEGVEQMLDFAITYRGE